MKKILIYSPDAGTALGHSFIYAARVCEEETAQGYEVILLTTRGFEERYVRTFHLKPAFAVLERTECDFSRAKMPAGFFAKLRYGWRRLVYSMRMQRELKKVLQTTRVDFHHWLDNPEIFSTLWFACTGLQSRDGQRGPRWYLNVHPGDLSFGGHATDPLRALYKAISGWGLKRLLRRQQVAKIFVHGDWTKRSLCQRWGFAPDDERLVVAPYGTDPIDTGRPRVSRESARQSFGLPQDRTVLLSFGMIRRDKGVDDIIRAVSLVPDVTLLMAGHPVDLEREEIHNWVKQAGILGRTILNMDYVSEEEIETYFRAADFLVIAHRASHTGNSGPMHLACSYLVPVVASNQGDIGEFVRTTGIGEVFQSGNWKALAEVLRDLLRAGPASYEAYRQRQREAAEKTSWKAMVEEYIRCYGEGS